MSVKDLLLEIGCAELPATGLQALARDFELKLKSAITQAQIKYDNNNDQDENINCFATPRRIAILIKNLESQQPDRQIEKKGPALSAPQQAKEGFARSCGVTVEQLTTVETPQGSWLIHRYTEIGKKTTDILPELISQTIKNLSLPKSMRWGSNEALFIRPVQWAVLLYGDDVINMEIFGIKTGRETRGHRFHHPQAISLANPGEYENKLKNNGFVIPLFDKRRELIRQKIDESAQKQNFKPELNGHTELLDEVTGLVEWPVALIANFDERFLNLPDEVLISSFQKHQKCFAVRNKDTGKLMPHFITISNIDSQDKKEVIIGNQSVVHARLSDAEFFYQIDTKRKLRDYVEDLKNVVFQKKLGTVYDRTVRIANLAQTIASNFGVNEKQAYDAGYYCKADLMTQMVGEFPELQGTMGYYYYKKEHEDKNGKIEKQDNEIAEALRWHYFPRYAGESVHDFASVAIEEQLPLLGCVVALAERFDTIVGLFGINQPPTGDKDPFALRRAAIGILQIIEEINKRNQKNNSFFDINLDEVIGWAISGYNVLSDANTFELPNQNVREQVREFILERMRAQYINSGVAADNVSAVFAVENLHPIDIRNRLSAVEKFRNLPEAAALAEANKRAKNILEKSAVDKNFFSGDAFEKIRPALFEKNEEQHLYNLIKDKYNPHLTGKEGQTQSAYFYEEKLMDLVRFHQPLNDYFNSVMVNAENQKIRQNRLLMMSALRQLFLQVADISLLQI